MIDIMKQISSLIVLLFVCNLTQSQNTSIEYDGYATKVILNTTIEITYYTNSMFRFRNFDYNIENINYRIPFVVGHIDPWEKVEVSVEQKNNLYLLQTAEIKLEVNLKTSRWKVYDKESGEILYPSDGPIYGMFKDGYSQFDSASFFNEKNDNSRYSHWFYNTETELYDIFLKEDIIKDEYFIYGPSYKEIYRQFNQLVGPEPLLPKKAYGFFQTQHLACHGDQEQLMSVAEDLRKKDIPADYLIIDFEWGDGCIQDKEIQWGSQLDWSENYKHPMSPKAMLDSLKAMNFDTMLIHHNAPNYKNRTKQGWTETVQPEDLWWKKWKEKVDIGVRGTWQDTRKNDITDSRIYTGTQHYVGKNERVLFMGARKMQAVNPWDFRYSVVPVNNIIGARRYPFDWTGDCSFNWNELKFQVKAITNSHGPLKGVSYISSDGVGESWQIQARWNQFSDFSAISRSHNPKPWAGNVDVANFQNKIKIEGRDSVIIKETPDNITHAVSGKSNGPTAENSIRKHRKERYKLLPYIYSIAYKNYLTGIPICRPMLIAFPDDYLCNSDTWPYQYMFGPNILVTPVYGDFKTMEIYLPRENDWIDYWSNEVYKGGGVINYNTEDVEKLPLFIKAGAILPKRPERNWIEEEAQEERLILDIYPSNNLSSFTLYEDDGKSIAYQKGDYSSIIISQSYSENGELIISIGKAKGTFNNKLISRTWNVRLLDVFDDYVSVSVNGEERKFMVNTDINETELPKKVRFKEVVIKELLGKSTTVIFSEK